MKKFVVNMLSLLAVAALLVTMAGIATAAATSGASRDENKLKAEITMLNAEAKLPRADKVISKQLTDSFNVKSDKIKSLLGKNMQYGEIAAILAFADKMPDGVTDANINKVMTLRKSRTGWDQIAKNLNVDITDVADKLSGIEDEAHKNIKEAMVESPAAGVGAGGVGESSGEMTGRPSEEFPGEATGGTGTDGAMSGGSSDVHERGNY